jgi:hypothetical protein
LMRTMARTQRTAYWNILRALKVRLFISCRTQIKLIDHRQQELKNRPLDIDITHKHTYTQHTISTEGICQLWNDCVTCVMTSNLQASHGLHWILHLRHNFTAKRHIIKMEQTSKFLIIIIKSTKTILVFC